MYELQEIINNIQNIAKERDLSVNKILTESGAGKDLIADMRKGRIPSVKKFADLADYLNVSVDYLLGRTENPEVNK